jgi:hypothetical protein
VPKAFAIDDLQFPSSTGKRRRDAQSTAYVSIPSAAAIIAGMP